jgi:hypothetical protein
MVPEIIRIELGAIEERVEKDRKKIGTDFRKSVLIPFCKENSLTWEPSEGFSNSTGFQVAIGNGYLGFNKCPGVDYIEEALEFPVDSEKRFRYYVSPVTKEDIR